MANGKYYQWTEIELWVHKGLNFNPVGHGWWYNRKKYTKSEWIIFDWVELCTTRVHKHMMDSDWVHV